MRDRDWTPLRLLMRRTLKYSSSGTGAFGAACASAATTGGVLVGAAAAAGGAGAVRGGGGVPAQAVSSRAIVSEEIRTGGLLRRAVASSGAADGGRKGGVIGRLCALTRFIGTFERAVARNRSGRRRIRTSCQGRWGRVESCRGGSSHLDTSAYSPVLRACVTLRRRGPSNADL